MRASIILNPETELGPFLFAVATEPPRTVLTLVSMQVKGHTWVLLRWGMADTFCGKGELKMKCYSNFANMSV